MNASARATSSGFSLAELLIGVAIMAIVMGLAAPSFLEWARAIQIKNAASSVATGMQRARAEAVARNTNVIFVLGADTSWTVSVVSPVAVIETRSGGEGSQDTTRTITPANATGLTFNNYGLAVPNAAGTSYSQVDFAAVGSTRSMRVTIGAGGSARVCDPSLVAGSKPAAC